MNDEAPNEIGPMDFLTFEEIWGHKNFKIGDRVRVLNSVVDTALIMQVHWEGDGRVFYALMDDSGGYLGMKYGTDLEAI